MRLSHLPRSENKRRQVADLDSQRGVRDQFLRKTAIRKETIDAPEPSPKKPGRPPQRWWALVRQQTSKAGSLGADLAAVAEQDARRAEQPVFVKGVKLDSPCHRQGRWADQGEIVPVNDVETLGQDSSQRRCFGAGMSSEVREYWRKPPPARPQRMNPHRRMQRIRSWSRGAMQQLEAVRAMHHGHLVPCRGQSVRQIGHIGRITAKVIRREKRGQMAEPHGDTGSSARIPFRRWRNPFRRRRYRKPDGRNSRRNQNRLRR